MSEHIVGGEFYGVPEGSSRWYSSAVNVITGCIPITRDCQACRGAAYAARRVTRVEGDEEYRGLVAVAGRTAEARWTGAVRLASRAAWVGMLDGSSHELVAINPLSDPFHHVVRDDVLLFLFRLMYLARWKTWMVLTTRHGRMARFMSRLYEHGGLLHLAPAPLPPALQVEIPNVWIGVKAGTQEFADKRVGALAKVKAAVRYVAVHPVLERIDLSRHVHAVDWVVAGGWDARGQALPGDLSWARGIRDACQSRGVPLFLAGQAYETRAAGAQFLDGALWHQFPRRELLDVPSASVRDALRAWAAQVEVAGVAPLTIAAPSIGRCAS